MEQTQKIVTKKKVSSRRFWKILFVFAVAFFVLFPSNKSLAWSIADCNSGAKWQCWGKESSSGKTKIVCLDTEDKNDCYEWCNSYQDVFYDLCDPKENQDAATYKKVNDEEAKFREAVWDLSDPFLYPFRILLMGVLKMMAWLLGLATIIFDYIVKSDNIESIMSNEGIYVSWAMVRDFLNLGFILVLLYIAFCVIFQIGSYSDSWKKMLLMMVIMALLVNFSYPICRVIIDFSNVAFYYLLNVGFPGKSGDAIFGQITNDLGFGDVIGTVGNGVSVVKLLAMIIFTFILAITLLVIAILFVVRMVAIGILIIFSPIGFAGAAFPFSKKYASQWWDNLFKYAFFAPIMIFMILVASKIMEVMNRDDKFAMTESARKNLGTEMDPNMFGSMAFFAIPIVVLWFGMHVANELSIKGASAVTGTADKFAKWAGKKASGADFAQRTWGAYSARRKQADEDRMSGKLGRLLGSQQDRLRGALPGGRDAQLRYQRDQIAQVKKEGERNDTVNMDETSLKQLAQSGDKFESAAAIMELAARGVADGTQLNNVRRNFGEDSQVAKQLQNKIKTYDAAAAFTNLRGEFQEARADEFVKSNQFDASKQNANSLGNAEFMQTVFGNNAISGKQVRDLAEKSSENKKALSASVGQILDLGGHDDTKDEMNRAMHMAHLAVTGGVHTSIDGPGRETNRSEIWSRLDGESGKNINNANVAAYADEIVDNMNVGNVRDFVKNMRDKTARASFMAGAKAAASGTANATAIQNHVIHDPYLSSL